MKKGFFDYLSLGIATCGVGYIPVAPGTWGSAVGVLIYLLIIQLDKLLWQFGGSNNWNFGELNAWRIAINIIICLLISAIGIWAGSRASKILNEKDPQKVVIDEVAGQLITLAFLPYDPSWQMIVVGFILFRFFDIAKPYPIYRLQVLEGGLGVMIDDIVAGIYAAIVMFFLLLTLFHSFQIAAPCLY